MKKWPLLFVSMGIAYFASSQQLQWVEALGGQSLADVAAVATDLDGNVYITGTFVGPIDFDSSSDDFIIDSGGADSYVLKLDSDGNILWVHHLDAVPASENLVHDITIDNEGSLLVVGEFTDRSNFDPGASDLSVDAVGRDGYIVKIGSDGTFEWVKTFGSSDCEIFSVDVDRDNNYFFTGGFRGNVDFDPGNDTERITSNGLSDIFLLKLNSDGELIWVQTHGSFEGEKGQLVLVEGDHVYWTGYFKHSLDFDVSMEEAVLTSRDESSDVFIQKLTLEGEHVWVRKYGGNSIDEGQHIAVDREGNVILGGDYLSEVYFSDDNSIVFPNIIGAGFVLKLNPEGDLQWVSIVKEHEALILDDDDQIHICGKIGNPFDFDPGEEELILEGELGDHLFVQKLSSDGEHLSIIEFPSLGGFGTNLFTDLSFDGQGNLVAVGEFRTGIDFDPNDDVLELEPDGFADGFVVKLSLESSTSFPAKDISSHINIYPNPAQHAVEISMSNLSSGKATLTLCNLQGIICSQSDVAGENSKIQIGEDLPNGMYMIRIEGVGTLPLVIQR